jgi:predicted aldo/keto reductase-like oxidoreductase
MPGTRKIANFAKKSLYKQDLHIHTEFSFGDRAVIQGMVPELIAWLRHAEVIGISDHFEYLTGKRHPIYKEAIKQHGFYCGTEVDGYKEAKKAIAYDFDYYIYHCRDQHKEYEGIKYLLGSGKPVIIAHPYAMGTNLEKVPSSCYVEINNRYIWRYSWKEELGPFIPKFKFVMSSDAHQPNWLNQEIARKVAFELGIEETLLF